MSIATVLQGLSKAIVFAADKHRNQRRKDSDSSPYINHPLDLLYVLVNEGSVFDQTTLLAAVLHDTVEDTDTSPSEIATIFGDDVLSVVLEVTDDKSLPKAERKQLQIEHAYTISDRAKLVKLADKICNLRDMVNRPPALAGWNQQRIHEYFAWSKRVIDQLRGVHPELESVFDQAYAMRPGRNDDC